MTTTTNNSKIEHFVSGQLPPSFQNWVHDRRFESLRDAYVWFHIFAVVAAKDHIESGNPAVSRSKFIIKKRATLKKHPELRTWFVQEFLAGIQRSSELESICTTCAGKGLTAEDVADILLNAALYPLLVDLQRIYEQQEGGGADNKTGNMPATPLLFEEGEITDCGPSAPQHTHWYKPVPPRQDRSDDCEDIDFLAVGYDTTLRRYLDTLEGSHFAFLLRNLSPTETWLILHAITYVSPSNSEQRVQKVTPYLPRNLGSLWSEWKNLALYQRFLELYVLPPPEGETVVPEIFPSRNPADRIAVYKLISLNATGACIQTDKEKLRVDIENAAIFVQGESHEEVPPDLIFNLNAECTFEERGNEDVMAYFWECGRKTRRLLQPVQQDGANVDAVWKEIFNMFIDHICALAQTRYPEVFSLAKRFHSPRMQWYFFRFAIGESKAGNWSLVKNRLDILLDTFPGFRLFEQWKPVEAVLNGKKLRSAMRYWSPWFRAALAIPLGDSPRKMKLAFYQAIYLTLIGGGDHKIENLKDDDVIDVGDQLIGLRGLGEGVSKEIEACFVWIVRCVADDLFRYDRFWVTEVVDFIQQTGYLCNRYTTVNSLMDRFMDYRENLHLHQMIKQNGNSDFLPPAFLQEWCDATGNCRVRHISTLSGIADHANKHGFCIFGEGYTRLLLEGCDQFYEMSDNTGHIATIEVCKLGWKLEISEYRCSFNVPLDREQFNMLKTWWEEVKPVDNRYVKEQDIVELVEDEDEIEADEPIYAGV